jgi:DNA polymerase III epsilon subunit-like protein
MSSVEIYVSVDVETSGPIPGEFSLLSIGACLVAAPDQSFTALVQPLNDNVVPEAMAATGLNLGDLKAGGLIPTEALARFETWVLAVAGSGRPVFVGFNAAFDWSFVNWYFWRFLGRNPFGVAALDIKSYYMAVAGVPWDKTRSSQMPADLRRLLEVGPQHDALTDARNQAKLFAALRDARIPTDKLE